VIKTTFVKLAVLWDLFSPPPVGWMPALERLPKAGAPGTQSFLADAAGPT